MMKKFTSMFLVVLLGFMWLSAVASAANREIKGEITVLTWQYQPDDPKWQELIAAFNQEYPNVKVKAVYTSDTVLEEKVATMVAGRIPLDVLWMKNPICVAMGDKGLLEDLMPYVRRDQVDLSQYFQNGWHERGPAWWRGKMYAINAVTMSYFYYYNKDMFDAVGLSYPSNDWDIAEYLRLSMKLTDPSKHQFGTNIRPWYGTYFIPWAWTFGGDWYNSDYSAVMFDSPGTIKAHQFIADLVNKYKVAPSINMQQTAGIDFSTQKIGIYYSGSWDISGTEQKPSKWPFRWGVVLPPKGPNGQHTVVHTNAWAMCSRSKNKEAAWAFIKWFIDKKAQIMLAKYGQYPANIQAAKEMAFLHMSPKDRETVFSSAENGKIYRLGTPANPQISRVWTKYSDLVLLGRMTAEEAMKAAAQEANVLLRELHKPPVR